MDRRFDCATDFVINSASWGDSVCQTTSPVKHPLVLVIDDDEDHRILAAYTLDLINCATLLVEDEETALSLAATHQPDLILLDIRLPKTNGLELLRELKEHPATREIPVIAVTALTNLDTFEQSLLKPLTGVLNKPYALEDLETLVTQQLAQRVPLQLPA